MRRWLAGTVLVMACASDPAPPGGDNPLVWRDAPVSVALGSATATLEAEAWRSLQPPSGPGGNPLLLLLRLNTTAALDAGTVIESVILRRNDDVWAGDAREEHPREAGATQVEFMVRNGPDWAPGDSVDVVARIRVAAGEGRVELRAPRLVIARVD